MGDVSGECKYLHFLNSLDTGMATFASESFSIFDDYVKGTKKNDTFYVSPRIAQRDFINGLDGYDKVVIGIHSRNFEVRR